MRAPAIRKLMADDGPLQLSLFDQQDLAEITSPDFPGERLVACRNPVLAADRARTRITHVLRTSRPTGFVLDPGRARERPQLHSSGAEPGQAGVQEGWYAGSRRAPQ